jgi:hypothetical protein
MTQRHDIDVSGLFGRASFFSDRWGDANISTEGAREAIEAAGFTPDEVRAVCAKHSKTFEWETTFLIHAPNAPWARNDDKHEKLALFLEFEVDEDYMPNHELAGTDDPRVIEAWRQAATFWAPAFAHLTTGLSAIDDPAARDIRPLFNLDAPHMASICAIVPLHAAAHHKVIENMLFENGISFPPSQHARIDAIGKLRWRLDEELPLKAFPDPAVRLDWPVRQPG